MAHYPELSRRVALVSGAAQGIGAETARAFAKQGTAVAIVDIDMVNAGKVATSITEAGGRAKAIHTDITDADAVNYAMESTVAAFGGLDIVVNCAGIAPAARINALQRLQRRASGCGDLDSDIEGIQGASILDLGRTSEAELSPAVREQISGVAVGAASPVQANGDQVSMIVVCVRETSGGGVPDRQEIEDRLREQELTMLSERYLRNLRREATIITRSQ